MKQLVLAGLIALTAGAASADVNVWNNSWSVSGVHVRDITDVPQNACGYGSGNLGDYVEDVSLTLGYDHYIRIPEGKTYQVKTYTQSYGTTGCYIFEGGKDGGIKFDGPSWNVTKSVSGNVSSGFHGSGKVG